jgi:hypothetical protein
MIPLNDPTWTIRERFIVPFHLLEQKVLGKEIRNCSKVWRGSSSSGTS